MPNLFGSFADLKTPPINQRYSADASAINSTKRFAPVVSTLGRLEDSAPRMRAKPDTNFLLGPDKVSEVERGFNRVESFFAGDRGRDGQRPDSAGDGFMTTVWPQRDRPEGEFSNPENSGLTESQRQKRAVLLTGAALFGVVALVRVLG